MSTTPTIAAIATASGPGAIGVVRVSGPKAATIACELFQEMPTPRQVLYRALRDSDSNIIDRAIVFYLKAPNSFTGEDTLELQTHGGPIVSQQVLSRVLELGAEPARAGEFSERAFLNGKIDLLQAEAIADLIESGSNRAARLAQNSLSGVFSNRVNHLVEELKLLRVQFEASVDFPEEELSLDAVQALAQRTRLCASAIESLLGDARSGARLNRGIDLVIVGPPNAGKSSLLNVLAQRDVAIVNATAGTTRDVISIDLELNGIPIRIHDTAGLRETDEQVEQEGMRRALTKLDEADGVIFLHSFDAPGDPTSLVLDDKPLFVVENKIDLSGAEPFSQRSGNTSRIALSAQTATGIENLTTAISETFDAQAFAESTVLARERHLLALKAAVDFLRIDDASIYEQAPELVAERLRLAMNELQTLTGEFSSEDLLGQIFSTFCIGK